MATISAETGASVDSFEHFFANNASKCVQVSELSVIRFPDKEHPYLMLYKIRMFAWRETQRVLFLQTDESGFDISVNMAKFKVVQSVVDRITDEEMKQVTDKLNEPSFFALLLRIQRSWVH